MPQNVTPLKIDCYCYYHVLIYNLSEGGEGAKNRVMETIFYYPILIIIKVKYFDWSENMKVLRQLGIILGILLLSHVIQRVIGLPIPSAVLGMFILLVLLLTGVVKLEMIEDVSNFLLKHLTFFFIPAGVSIMTQLNLIKDSWLSFLLVALISTILVIVTTGIISQRLLKVKEGGK